MLNLPIMNIENLRFKVRNILTLQQERGKKMKYISIREPHVVEILEKECPKPEKGEALLKMLYGGICGSDLGTYRGTFAYAGYPRIPGHEIAAEIVEVPDNDLGLKPGMVVTVNPYFNCGKCYSCQHGLVNACMHNETLGAQRDGVFSQYFTAPLERIYDGKGLPPKILAAIEPFCIGYHGVKRAMPKPGEKVLIVGSGTIGNVAMLAAKSFGADVYMCDIAEGKLEFARENGVSDVIVNSSPEVFQAEVDRLTGGNGFDVTIEAVGLASTFQNCIDAAAFGGRVVLIGVSKQSLDFAFNVIQKKELNIFGSRNALKEDFLALIDLVSEGKVQLDDIITDVYPFEQAAEAFHQMETNGAHMLKTLLQF